MRVSSRSESTAVELPWFCPRCERTVLDSEVSDDCIHAPCGHEAVLRRDLSSVEYHQSGLHSLSAPGPVVQPVARMCVGTLTDGWPKGLTCRRDDDAAWEVLFDGSLVKTGLPSKKMVKVWVATFPKAMTAAAMQRRALLLRERAERERANSAPCRCTQGRCCDACWAREAQSHPCLRPGCQQPSGHLGECGPLRNVHAVQIGKGEILAAIEAYGKGVA